MSARCRNCTANWRRIDIAGHRMESRIVTLDSVDWFSPGFDPRWIDAVEDGKVLYFPRLAFPLSPQEQALLRPDLLRPGVRNVSLDTAGELKGAAGEPAVQAAVRTLLARFAASAKGLIDGLFPAY